SERVAVYSLVQKLKAAHAGHGSAMASVARHSRRREQGTMGQRESKTRIGLGYFLFLMQFD
ncbi:MAG TPA: hypothetical protein VIO33_10725, partial [Burkholderiaceae bacterium]